MNYGQLRKMKRKILSRTVLESIRPIYGETPLTAMDAASPINNTPGDYIILS